MANIANNDPSGQVTTQSYLGFGQQVQPPAGKIPFQYGPGMQAASPSLQFATGGTAGPQYTPFVPQYDTSANLLNQFYQWSDSQLAQFRAQMGLLNSAYLTAPVYDPNGAVTGTNSLQAAWTGLVQAAQNSTAAGKPMSPWSILASDISANNGGQGKAGQEVTKDYDQTSLSSKVDAQAIFFQSAQQLLGRAPTDSEVAQFQGDLNAMERANPVHHHLDIMYTPQGIPITLDKGQSGGVTDAARQLLALQQAQKNPDYGAYQASTTYMNALKKAIGLAGG